MHEPPESRRDSLFQNNTFISLPTNLQWLASENQGICMDGTWTIMVDEPEP